MDATKIITRQEIAGILADLVRRSKRSDLSRRNMIIFRLSCCCGLRVKEICGLDLGDLIASGAKPALRVRKAITKGQIDKRKGRIVPLWWDAGTLADLAAWREFRLSSLSEIGDLGAPLVCSLSAGSIGKRLQENQAAKQWRTAIKVLGAERCSQLSIHSGRHSFCSHALSVGRSLAEVRDAAGHANIATTSIYLHVLERTGVPDLFSFTEPQA